MLELFANVVSMNKVDTNTSKDLETCAIPNQKTEECKKKHGARYFLAGAKISNFFPRKVASQKVARQHLVEYSIKNLIFWPLPKSTTRRREKRDHITG